MLTGEYDSRAGAFLGKAVLGMKEDDGSQTNINIIGSDMKLEDIHDLVYEKDEEFEDEEFEDEEDEDEEFEDEEDDEAYCPSCGAPVSADSNFCEECGEKLK